MIEAKRKVSKPISLTSLKAGQPVRDFYVFRSSGKEKGKGEKGNFKPQSKVIFCLKLNPLQHIKR